MNFWLGCAVWAYKGWVGNFYPQGSRSGELLHLYSQRLTSVEGNTTFYVTPDAETMRGWAAEVSPGFQFCLKLPRRLTHAGYLQPGIPESLRFLELTQVLGQHQGPIFAQLPPSYGPEGLADLTAFLSAWPRATTPLALEVRHPGWFQSPHQEQLTELLHTLQVGRVLLDSRPVYTAPEELKLYASERRKPQLPLQPSVTSQVSLIRFISHPDPMVNQPFLQEWVQQVSQWLSQGIQVYFFVHCPIEEHSPSNARDFQRLLEAAQVPVPGLPWDHLAVPPTQLSLF